MNLNANESNIKAKFNYRDLLIFLVPIIIFLLYLFVYNPGVLTATSFSQLHQIAVGKFTTAHPIFHTLLLMLFIKIFGTPFYMGLFQILVFSAMWAVICKYHRDDSAKNSNGFVVQFIITLIICLIPINAIYSITISSYVLFSYSIMFLCFLIKVMLDKNGQVGTKLIILMALTIGVMSGLNNYGIVIAIPTLIMVAYYLLKKGTSENTFVTFVGLAVLCIFLIASLNFVYDVQRDNLKIPNADAFENDINLNAARNQFFSTFNGEPSQDYEKFTSVNAGKSNFNMIDSFVDTWQDSSLLNLVFNNPIIYMILSVLLLTFIYLKTESNRIFLVYLPPLLNTVISILTGQNIIYSNILVFYLIAIMCIGVYFKPNLTNNVQDRPQSIARPEIQTRNQFEIEENYIDDDYYSELESELEELTLDDINKMLGETPIEETQKIQKPPEIKQTQEKQKPQKTEKPPKKEQPKEKQQTIPQGDSDLIDEILKEMGKK